MRNLIDILLEGKDELPIKFVEYLQKNGEEDELRSCRKSYYDYYNDCDLMKNRKFNDFGLEGYEAESYCEDNGLDDINDDIDGFIEYCKNIVDERLYLDFERGLIKCERMISLNSSNFSKYKGLGTYWTFMEGNSHDYGDEGPGIKVIVNALVDPKDVDWAETIAANIADEDECELNIKEGSPIQICKIKDKDDNILFEGSLVYKA